MKAMILAAGLGTRLKPYTDSKPKALVEINGKTLLEIVINRLKSFGIQHIIINVHHFREQIIQFINENNKFGIDIQISEEEELLDTGGGLKHASWFFNSGEPFLLHNVDVLTNLNYNAVLDYHIRSRAIATLAVRERKSNRYFLKDENNNLCGWESISPPDIKIIRKSPNKFTRVSFMGIHIISPQIFEYITELGCFSIVDTYLRLSEANPIKLLNCEKYNWMDLGRPENLLEASRLFQEVF